MSTKSILPAAGMAIIAVFVAGLITFVVFVIRNESHIQWQCAEQCFPKKGSYFFKINTCLCVAEDGVLSLPSEKKK